MLECLINALANLSYASEVPATTALKQPYQHVGQTFYPSFRIDTGTDAPNSTYHRGGTVRPSFSKDTGTDKDRPTIERFGLPLN